MVYNTSGIAGDPANVDFGNVGVALPPAENMCGLCSVCLKVPPALN